jgi:uncharacterized protein involved in exopolysaccharide biosynthesis
MYNLDLNRLLASMIYHKRQYVIVIGVSIIVGLIVSFSLPKSYTTKVMLAPETNTENTLGGLSSMASLVGVNVNGMSSDAIFPEIYPDVVSATNFLVDLSNIKVKSMDNTISTTLYDYMETKQKSPWWFSLFSFGKEKHTGKNLDAHKLNKEQSGIIKAIGASISCSVNGNTSVITIKATAQDPLISATIADSVSARLQKFITDYRTNKARNDLNNIQKLYTEAKSRYDKARQIYCSYADANIDVVLESFKAKQTELENEMQLQYNLYTQATTQLQMAKAKVIEKTPVYAVLQPSTVPYRHSSPKKSLVILAFLFVGLFGYTVYLAFLKK